ncbi:MAG: 3-deoxy-manno-octulosonate cytidylyltransferase [Candidatus Omnitrophica bacterium]|nr:3-deoxy-manno-octulosonate cytidylyltransferase [Candidatus Omnitrophota bacterium]
METLGVIPARYLSTRLAGKVLLEIAGKPLVQHVYERARKAKQLDELWIATDDPRVQWAASSFGAKVVMTSPTHTSGTDRVAEVVRKMKVKQVVNIQADEPLVAPAMVDLLVETLKGEPKEVGMATLCRPLRRLVDQKDLTNPHVVKVVMDLKGYAIYFSRAAVPFHRTPSSFKSPRYFKHLGFYAYRQEFLLRFTTLAPSPLELTEGLEQLRALEHGEKIRVVQSPFDTVGVDTYEDLEKVRRILEKN